jgi:hypothetical protein
MVRKKRKERRVGSSALSSSRAVAEPKYLLVVDDDPR